MYIGVVVIAIQTFHHIDRSAVLIEHIEVAIPVRVKGLVYRLFALLLLAVADRDVLEGHIGPATPCTKGQDEPKSGHIAP